ncbi:MAG: diguanylate cyclase [Firmicutes bacterium]|nr:diguanylate cyclase [Bacillota bacterium]
MYSTKLVTRENTIKRLINNVQNYFYENKLTKLSVITGEFGTGKSALLNLFITRLNFEGEYAVLAPLSKDLSEDYSGIKNIVQKILKYADKNLIEKYSDQLYVLIPKLNDREKANNFIVEEADESYKMVYRLGNFILETSLNWPFVIVLKNYNCIDELSKKVINYIMECQDRGKIYFVVSFDEEVLDENVVDYFKPQLDFKDIDIIQLTNYNIYETAEAIRILLGMSNAPIDFAAKVYRETEGNPHLVYETICAAFSEKLIYVDDKGNWVLKDIDFSKITLSVDIDDILKNRINKLEPNKKIVLDIISIFKMPVPIDILESMSGFDAQELLPFLDRVVYLNILSKKMDDWGITYDFTSMSLKKSVYDAINAHNQLKYHEKASQMLKEKYRLEKRENKDELIYQMAKSGRSSEAIDYLLKSSKDMIKNHLINQAIQFLEQAYDLVEKGSDLSKVIEVSMRLGDLYYQISEDNKSLNQYEIAEERAKKLGDTHLIADIYIKKIYIYYRLNNIKKCLEYSRLAKREIKASNYKNGMLDLILALSDLLIYRRKLNTCIKILEKVLKDLNKEDKYYYGMFLSVYGAALVKRSCFKEAIEALNESMEILEELKLYKGLIMVMNNLGIIYSVYYGNIQKAKKYFEEAIIICQRTNNTHCLIKSYNNLAETYKREDAFKKSLVYYNKALELMESFPNIYTQAILYISCSMISLEMENYNKYKNYIDKAKDIIFYYKDTGDAVYQYYISESIFLYSMGMYEDAFSNSEKALGLAKSWNIHIDSDLALVNTLCKIKLTKEMDYNNLKELCVSLFAKKDYRVSGLACNKIAELYLEKNDIKSVQSFVELSKKYEKFSNIPQLNLNFRYLDAMTFSGKKRPDLLKALVDDADKFDNNELRWKIYKAIGLEVAKSGDLNRALCYMLTSFNCLRILVDGVPKDYKINFIKSHNRYTVKEELLTLAKEMTGKEGSFFGYATLKDEDKDIENIINEYFYYKKFKDLLIKDSNLAYGIDGEEKADISGKLMSDFLYRINNFSNSIEESIKELVEILKDFTQAKNAFLAITDDSSSLRFVYTSFKNENLSFYKYITEKARQIGESIIIPDVFEYKKKMENSLIPKDISAVFCFPVTSFDTVVDFEIERRNVSNSCNISGFIYLDTDSIINNFSNETGDLCNRVTKIAHILIDNYNLKMVNAIDKLTKLYTRKYFENALLNEISNAAIKSGEFSIIMSDIDRFKAINDRYGHQVGDKVLVKISELIMNSLRRTDICARYGGEEFIMLLPSTNTTGALNLAEKIRKALESANIGLHQNITISMGIASYPTHSTWMKDLIDKADQALYHSKETGRNKTTVYDTDLVKTAGRVDKMIGIITGNMSEDINNVESIIEILELQRDNSTTIENKIFNFLGKMIEMSGAKEGIVFIVDNNKPVKHISRRGSAPVEINGLPYNAELLNKCIISKSGEYLIDWSSSVAIDTVTGMPDWQSVMIIPITNYGEVNGVLYLSTSLKSKEFDASIYNYISTLCNIAAPMFLNMDF